MEITQKSISWWMDKCNNVVYLYNGTLLHKKKWSTDTYYNMKELGKTLVSENHQSQKATYLTSLT